MITLQELCSNCSDKLYNKYVITVKLFKNVVMISELYDEFIKASDNPPMSKIISALYC